MSKSGRAYTTEELKAFVLESNRIEDIHVRPNLDPSRKFLKLDTPTLADLEEFVWDTANRGLRAEPGMNVRIGDHVPPRGGPGVVETLESILREVFSNSVPPFVTHCEYEGLHPFMDGNGRSGRILWAWQMLHHNIAPGLSLGFLHAFYYQTLAAERPNA